MYRVIKSFTDKVTKHVYWEGKTYPVDDISDGRLEELTSSDNAHREPLIELVAEEPGKGVKELAEAEEAAAKAMEAEEAKAAAEKKKADAKAKADAKKAAKEAEAKSQEEGD